MKIMCVQITNILLVNEYSTVLLVEENRTAAFTAARVYHHEEEKTFLCNKIIFFKYREEVLYDTKKFSYLLDLSIDILRYLVYLYK